MNYLAHLLLTENSPDSRIGSILADFTNIANKSLNQHFNHEISKAIIIHREIDRYTDAHEDVTSAIRLFFPKYRHYSRIIVDILFDHFLTVHWDLFCSQSLDSFVESIYKIMGSLPEGMPQKFIIFSGRLIQYDLLRAYLTIDDLGEVFYRVDKRLKFPIGMQFAIEECRQHYSRLNELFLSFFPQLSCFTSNFMVSDKDAIG